MSGWEVRHRPEISGRVDKGEITGDAARRMGISLLFSDKLLKSADDPYK